VTVDAERQLDLAEARAKVAELGAKLETMRRLRTLGRALRRCETVEQIVEASVSFVHLELGVPRCALLLDGAETGVFDVVGSSGLSGGEVAPVEREPVAVALGEGAEVLVVDRSADAALLALAEIVGGLDDGACVVPFRDAADAIFGLLLVGGAAIEHELLNEVAFESSSALSASLLMRARAEELAMLEVQERELVVMLRDVEERDAIIRKGLEAAREFQHLMLGKIPRIPGVILDTLYEPLELVGGDLYAVTHLGRVLRIFVADATGHGVRGALTTMCIKSGYESVARTASSPAALLEALNQDIASTFRTMEMLFTAVCVDIDLATFQVAVAAAAHPAPIVVRRGHGEIIDCTGPLMGIKPDMRVPQVSAALEPGDAIYIISDGLPEARDADGNEYGEAAVASLLASVSGEASPGTVAGDRVRAFTGRRGFSDDVTLVGVRLLERQAIG
jgi:serine phosphatase RsbU (regulator of sigma subunit)